MDEKRFNSKKFVTIGHILEKMIQQYHPQFDKELLKVWDIWEDVVGTAIASNARPAAFKGSILLLHVSNSTWLHHLHFLEEEIITKLNQAIGSEQVKFVQFKIGPI
jgi:predicted nucleic acid-binding Zn ribbon protein